MGEPPIVPPYKNDSMEQFEAGFLLIDRLIALGYRRIQYSIDSQDAPNRKLGSRLGFSLEGQLCKHMIIKESSRDSNIYGLTNSDWDKGARFALYRSVYGKKAADHDNRARKKDEEVDIQNSFLREEKEKEAANSNDTENSKKN